MTELSKNDQVPQCDKTAVIASTDDLTKYPDNYLCYCEIIDMINLSENLKELEVLINRKFNK
jgi:hypothetical protein